MKKLVLRNLNTGRVVEIARGAINRIELPAEGKLVFEDAKTGEVFRDVSVSKVDGKIVATLKDDGTQVIIEGRNGKCAEDSKCEVVFPMYPEGEAVPEAMRAELIEPFNRTGNPPSDHRGAAEAGFFTGAVLPLALGVPALLFAGGSTTGHGSYDWTHDHKWGSDDKDGKPGSNPQPQPKPKPDDGDDDKPVPEIVILSLAGDGTIDHGEYTGTGADFKGKVSNMADGQISLAIKWNDKVLGREDVTEVGKFDVKDGKWSIHLDSAKLNSLGFDPDTDKSAEFVFSAEGAKDKGENVMLDLKDPNPQKPTIVVEVWAGGDYAIDMSEWNGAIATFSGRVEDLRLPQGQSAKLRCVAEWDDGAGNAKSHVFSENIPVAADGTWLFEPLTMDIRDSGISEADGSKITVRFELVGDPDVNASEKVAIEIDKTISSIEVTTMAGGDSNIDANEYNDKGTVFQGKIKNLDPVPGMTTKVTCEVQLFDAATQKTDTRKLSQNIEVDDQGNWTYEPSADELKGAGLSDFDGKIVDFIFARSDKPYVSYQGNVAIDLNKNKPDPAKIVVEKWAGGNGSIDVDEINGDGTFFTGKVENLDVPQGGEAKIKCVIEFNAANGQKLTGVLSEEFPVKSDGTWRCDVAADTLKKSGVEILPNNSEATVRFELVGDSSVKAEGPVKVLLGDANPMKIKVENWAGGDSDISSAEFGKDGALFEGKVESVPNGLKTKVLCEAIWTEPTSSNVITKEMGKAVDVGADGGWSILVDAGTLQESGIRQATGGNLKFHFKLVHYPNVNEEGPVTLKLDQKLVIDDISGGDGIDAKEYFTTGTTITGHVEEHTAGNVVKASMKVVDAATGATKSVDLGEIEPAADGKFTINLTSASLVGLGLAKPYEGAIDFDFVLKDKSNPTATIHEIKESAPVKLVDKTIILDKVAGDAPDAAKIDMSEYGSSGAFFQGRLQNAVGGEEIMISTEWAGQTYTFAQRAEVGSTGRWQLLVSAHDLARVGYRPGVDKSAQFTFKTKDAEDVQNDVQLDLTKYAHEIKITKNSDGDINWGEYSKHGLIMEGTVTQMRRGRLWAKILWNDPDGAHEEFLSDSIYARDNMWHMQIPHEKLQSIGYERANGGQVTVVMQVAGDDSTKVAQLMKIETEDKMPSV